MNTPRATRSDALVLAALALSIALVRLFNYHEPPEWDVGTYLVVAHELNAGERLYLGVWDSKPPAVYTTYAVAERVAGYGARQVYLLCVLAAWITMIGVFVVGSAQGRAAGRWAALFWACTCFDPNLGADQPNTEAFINAAVVWAVALLVRVDGTRRAWGTIVTVGALFAVASFYKQVAVAPALVIAGTHLLWPPEGVTRRGALAQALVLGLIGVLAWAALFGYFTLTGRGWLFAQTMFVHPRWYQGDVIANLAASLAPANLFGPDVRSLLPLALAALLALLPRPAGAPRRPGRLLAAAAVGTHLAVAWPGQFHDHYYQLWLPVLCVAAAGGVVRLGSLSRMPNRWLARALGAVLAAALLWPQVSWFTLSPDARAERKHGGMFARALRDGREIASLMRPGETLYTWSDEAWLYHVARRRVPAAGLWKSHALEGPLAHWLARRTVEDLERNPPDFFVDWATIDAPADHPIRHWLESRYTPLADGKTRWPFVVYVRDGSDAQRRLSRRP